MTNPEPAGSAHPARAAGIALLGVAAVALVIGVVSLFTGDDDSNPPGAQSTEQTTTSTSTSASATESSDPTSSSSATTTSATNSSQPTTSTTPAPSSNGQAASTATPPPPVTPVVKPPVRVYNNSTVPLLAARAAEDVERSGWQVAETGNYSQGQIPTTTVYFRPGTDEEASARLLAEALRARVEPRFNGITAAHAGIIVIVTNDYQGPSAKS
jgi:LytR cell envelope-related transcriptional attenuator